MKLAISLRRTLLASLGSSLALASFAGCSDDTSGRDTNPEGIQEAEAEAETPGDGDGDETGDGDQEGDGDGDNDDEPGDGDPSGDEAPYDPKWDVGTMPDSPDICLVPTHNPCDHLEYPSEEAAAWRALGLNCPGEFQATIDYNGHYLALMVQEGQLGTYNPATYPVREGEKMVILSTGDAFDITEPGADGDTSLPNNDPGNLPAPMSPQKVSDSEDCHDNATLIGMGDCSNTIADQFLGTDGAYDYAEMRFSITVPTAVNAFSYNVAFLSFEYPDFYGWAYNDIYIAWLSSEEWTGNITFDAFGSPLSLNAGFLDYKDAPNFIDCPLPCDAPELQGTGLEGHGGTQWLETTWPVESGETITVIFAIMDIQDNIVDSAVLLDNFRWTCFGGIPGTVIG
ncbi:MAG TPA: choice-of-anchor L domain-containing protein [Enhygromyxa sp.]|nr:choice-of-anchor L domain-containing protein [Enhygromyxa sp.]